MDYLIAKKLFDKLTKEEDEVLNKWIDENPNNQNQLIQSINAAVLIDDCEKLANVNVDESWNNFQSKLNVSTIYQKNKSDSIINLLMYQSRRIAAVIVVLVGICFAFEYVSYTKYNTELSSMDLVMIDDSNERIEITTTDDLDVIVLPDKSLVYLNKNSTLIYDEKFNQNQRLVYLQGECFFKVAKDSKRPFIVYTDFTKTKVTGTSFNIKAYKTELTTELTVFSGKVSFSKLGELDGDMIYLTKDDRVSFRNTTHLVKKSKIENTSQLAWLKDGYLENYILPNDKKLLNDHFDNNSTVEMIAEATLNELSSPQKLIKINEVNKPMDYLSNTAKWSNILFWEGNLSKITRIEGFVLNSAVYSVYNNLIFKATLYDAQNKIIGREEFTLNESLGPGDKVEYKKQLILWDSKTKNVIVELIEATAEK